MPKFSIIMANYNNGPFIEQAIGSVLAQPFTDWELIIVDDGSEDDSLERIQKYRSDQRIRLFVNERNQGIAPTQIFALTKVTSEIVGILDSDDALATDAIEKAHKIHSQHPELGLVLSQATECDSELSPLTVVNSTPKNFRRNLLWGSSGTNFRTFKLAAYQKTTGLDPRIRYAVDWDLLLKLDEVAPAHQIDEPLYLIRLLKSSATQGIQQYQKSRRTHAFVLYNAYMRRRRPSMPNLPREAMSAWMVAAVRQSVELGEPLQAIYFALRGLRIAPFEGSAYRALITIGKYCLQRTKSLGGGRVSVSMDEVTKLRSYPVREFQSNTGNLEPDRVVCIPLVHKKGHCLFGGDYLVRQDGRYRATFELSIDPYEFAEDPLVVLDIYENLQTKSILAERQINRADLSGKPNAFSVEFSAEEGQRLEFRVFWAEQCFLTATGVGLEQIHDSAQ